MRFTHIKLVNWKNFKQVDVTLPERAFLIGPNASGKSNFLDVFRFLRDLARPGGGLQRACEERGGISKIRCLLARNPSDIQLSVSLRDDDNNRWTYEIHFAQQGQFPRQGTPIIRREFVQKNDDILLERPQGEDLEDERLLEQTHLEQISNNRSFRSIADHFEKIAYLHLVPQMIRNTSAMAYDSKLPDFYGGRFLETVANTSDKTRKRYLRHIEQVLQIAVPQLEELQFTVDARGIPHLEARYKHWRPNAGRQNENQFSDGTLRLIGLLWALEDGTGLVLMEEPELSLHQGIVRQLAPFIYKAQRRSKTMRQAFISTHSVDLLSSEGIGADELLVFMPTSDDGTRITSGHQIEQVRLLMANGIPAGEAALPHTEPENIQQTSNWPDL